MILGLGCVHVISHIPFSFFRDGAWICCNRHNNCHEQTECAPSKYQGENRGILFIKLLVIRVFPIIFDSKPPIKITINTGYQVAKYVKYSYSDVTGKSNNDGYYGDELKNSQLYLITATALLSFPPFLRYDIKLSFRLCGWCIFVLFR